ncbi:MAG: ferritin family protein [Desulfosalsimonas sp.]
MLKSSQKEVLELMIKQESLLAKLYGLFAEQFPEHREVWKELNREEENHANWLRQLYDAGEKSIILFNDVRVKTPALRTYVAHLGHLIERAEKKELTLDRAVAYTLDFEKSLIEKNVFSHFDSASEKARSVLNRLRSETENHIKRIQAIKW